MQWAPYISDYPSVLWQIKLLCYYCIIFSYWLRRIVPNFLWFCQKQKWDWTKYHLIDSASNDDKSIASTENRKKLIGWLAGWVFFLWRKRANELNEWLVYLIGPNRMPIWCQLKTELPVRRWASISSLFLCIHINATHSILSVWRLIAALINCNFC